MFHKDDGQDHGLEHITPAGKIDFNAETYVYNWYEDTVRNTLKRQQFLKKRECAELSIQKSQKMVDIVLKPVELTANVTPFIRYGDTIQLVSPGPDCKTAMDKYPFKRNHCKLGHLALSASVPPSVIDYAPYLNTDSIISASPHLFPVVRNSFVVENPDCFTDTSPLNYGEVFRLRAISTQHFELYLFSSPGIRLHSGALHSGKTKVRLSDIKTADTLWRAVPLDPYLQIQMNLLGLQVPLKTRLMIKHACSGNNMSLESDFPVLTYFGEEYEVTLDTKRDSVKRISFENHWYFDTERGWRKPDDKEMMEQAKLSAAINAHNNDVDVSDKPKIENEEDEEEICEIPPEQCYEKELSKNLENVAISGNLEYDPMTAPQPNAHSYRISENQEFYPNKKWNCGDTDCCHPHPPSTTTTPCDQKKTCYDTLNKGAKETR